MEKTIDDLLRLFAHWLRASVCEVVLTTTIETAPSRLGRVEARRTIGHCNKVDM